MCMRGPRAQLAARPGARLPAASHQGRRAGPHALRADDRTRSTRGTPSYLRRQRAGPPRSTFRSSRSRPAAGRSSWPWAGRAAGRPTLVCPDDRHAACDRRAWRRRTSCCTRARRCARRGCWSCFWEGDTLGATPSSAQLIYKHYAARRSGKTPLPMLFCNTCFTRGGGWLNECNAENQISLINALRAARAGGAADRRRLVHAAAGRPAPATGPRARTPIRKAWGRWPRRRRHRA